MSNENEPRASRPLSSLWSVENVVLSVVISLLVLILGVALGKIQFWMVVLSGVVVLCAAAAGAFLTVRTFHYIPANARNAELMRAIQAELTHITRSLPSYLLTEEQYSRIESSPSTRAVIICMREMGLEFDPDPEQREVLTVSYDRVVRENIARGVTYHWIAPHTGRNRVRTDVIIELFGEDSIRTRLLPMPEWQLLPFVFETVFIVSENLNRKHVDCFLQIPIPAVGAERYWIKIEPDLRDEWFSVARQHLDEAILRLRKMEL